MEKELKKYIKNTVSNYHCDIPLDYLKDKLDKWITEYNLDMDPAYQRGYVWTDKQKKDYVEYVIRLGKDQSVSGRQFYFNHPNWMGSWENENGLGFEVVDGKQRLNALLGWLNGEFGVFEENIYYNSAEGLGMSSHSVSFNIAKLKTKEEVVDWYVSMNTGGTMHTDEDIQRALDYKNKE